MTIDRERLDNQLQAWREGIDPDVRQAFKLDRTMVCCGDCKMAHNNTHLESCRFYTGKSWGAPRVHLEHCVIGRPDRNPLAKTATKRELTAAVRTAIDELTAEHRPHWVAPGVGFTEQPIEGRVPVGCVVCYPADGSWPCTSRMVADDLMRILGPQT